VANEADKVYDLLKEYDNVMLVTHGDGERLDARPMHVAEVTEDCDLWFLTRIDEKVEQLRSHPQAQVVAQDEKDSWLSLSGRVEILNDRARVAELWQEPYRAWFPDGKDDPDLRVLAFRSERGEYWDQRGAQKVEYALKVARAYLTGDAPEPDSGEHGTTRL
jgi:general stress protein 26